MQPSSYPIPNGTHAIDPKLLDLRSEDVIDQVLLHPTPVSNEKNVWFFWHSGYGNMHPYTKRNIRAWHRRFSKQGWTIRVLSRQPNSASNIANFLDTEDPETFPRSFIDGTIGGEYAPQHTSDLVRWPLLLKHGGVYADVGMMQIGDLDSLWNTTVGNPASPFELISYRFGEGQDAPSLTNYFLASKRDNPLFLRCHKLLLELWAADGGKSSTDGMHASPLLKGLPLMGGGFTIEEDGNVINAEECSRMLTDYIIQGHVMTMVMNLYDEEDGWDGPRYTRDHVYAIDFMVGAQLINSLTAWNGRKAWELMSLAMPSAEGKETSEQQEAREIVEACLQRSFGFKLAHGMILRVFKEGTLGSLWRKYDGSDNVPGTYAHWLRYGTVHWTQDTLPARVDFPALGPLKKGPLLKGI